MQAVSAKLYGLLANMQEAITYSSPIIAAARVIQASGLARADRQVEHEFESVL